MVETTSVEGLGVRSLASPEVSGDTAFPFSLLRPNPMPPSNRQPSQLILEIALQEVDAYAAIVAEETRDQGPGSFLVLT